MNNRRIATLGFTLIEMIVTITVLGILAAMVAAYMRIPIAAYFDAERRARLTDSADGAVRRIARDVRAALPNSLRGLAGTVDTESCFEFLPLAGGGRYRAVSLSGTLADANDGSNGDYLNFAAADTSFQVLGQVALPPSSFTSYDVVVYNLGLPGSDAYADGTMGCPSGVATCRNRARVADPAVLGARASLAAATQFPLASPGNSFQVIESRSVGYSCPGDGKLYRFTRDWSGAAFATATWPLMGACPSTGDVLVDKVTACSFRYVPAFTQRNGLLTMNLTLGDTGSSEYVRIFHEVHVNNAP